MNKKFAVITGANRRNGIGLALVRVFAENGWTVVGTFRSLNTSQSLHECPKQNSRVHALQLDVTSDSSTSSFKSKLQHLTDSIDVLINNAGMPSSGDTIVSASINELVQQMQVHAIGPIRVTQNLLPFLENSSIQPAKAVVITSVLGTISSVGSGWTHYAPCKAAANALVRQMGSVLRGQGISMFALHPGWVATDIGGRRAPVSPIHSAEGIYRVISLSDMRDAVTFRDYQGSQLQW